VVQSGRSSQQVIESIGGASRDRTDDLIVANYENWNGRIWHQEAQLGYKTILYPRKQALSASQ